MIKAENLTKIFGGKKALDSVNVTIYIRACRLKRLGKINTFKACIWRVYARRRQHYGKR